MEALSIAVLREKLTSQQRDGLRQEPRSAEFRCVEKNAAKTGLFAQENDRSSDLHFSKLRIVLHAQWVPREQR